MKNKVYFSIYETLLFILRKRGNENLVKYLIDPMLL